jgi:hypothetical protein
MPSYQQPFQTLPFQLQPYSQPWQPMPDYAPGNPYEYPSSVQPQPQPEFTPSSDPVVVPEENPMPAARAMSAPLMTPTNAWTPSQPTVWGEGSNGDNGNGNGLAPTWRRSFTPLPGQAGCYNRCRPSCSNAWGGCQPTCKSACNIQPRCPTRDRFYKTPFPPKTCRIKFHPKTLDKFPLKTTHMKFIVEL